MGKVELHLFVYSGHKGATENRMTQSFNKANLRDLKAATGL